MATCTNTIQSLIASGSVLTLPQIYSNTATNFNVTPTTPAVLLLQTTASQSISFTVSGSSSAGAGSPVNLTLTIYSYIGGVATSLGSVSIVNANTSFQQDFGSGSYILCISTGNTANFSGYILGTFTGYPTVASMTAPFKVGDRMSFAFYAPPPTPGACKQPIWYELVDGSLPPGITLSVTGLLDGVFPNLDCVQDDNPYSPAMNWFYSQNGTSFPVGRQWRFQVKCWLEAYPTVQALQWFCIRIYNDWSLDRDNFLAQPKEQVVTIQQVTPPIPLPAQCEPCPITTTPLPVFHPIIDPCPACNVPIGTTITSQSIMLPSAPAVLNQRGPNDLDTMFLEWGNTINQENPWFTSALATDSMEVTINVYPAAT